MITKIEQLEELIAKSEKEHGKLQAYGYDCGFNEVEDYEICFHFENKYVKHKCLESVFLEFMHNAIEKVNKTRNTID